MRWSLPKNAIVDRQIAYDFENNTGININDTDDDLNISEEIIDVTNLSSGEKGKTKRNVSDENRPVLKKKVRGGVYARKIRQERNLIET